MEHDDWRALVLSLGDRDMAAGDRRAAEGHLASCGACREEKERWGIAQRALFAAEPSARSEFFVTRVMARLEEPAPRAFGWARFLLTAAPVLAALFLAFSPAKEPEPSTESLLLEGRSGPVLTSLPMNREDLLGAVMEDEP